MTSFAVLLAIILTNYRIMYVEGIVTILISIFILKEGLSSTKEAVFSLMDVAPSKEVERKIIHAVSKISGIEGFGSLKLRKSGPFIFGEMNIVIKKQAKAISQIFVIFSEQPQIM